MKIIVKGTSYDAVGPEQAPLSLLMRLKTETGIGMADIDKMSKASKPVDGTETAAADQDAALIILGITIWLSMNVAGDKVSFDDATSCTLTDIEIVEEPGDPGAAAVDPTVPEMPLVSPGSVADGNSEPVPAGM